MFHLTEIIGNDSLERLVFPKEHVWFEARDHADADQRVLFSEKRLGRNAVFVAPKMARPPRSASSDPEVEPPEGPVSGPGFVAYADEVNPLAAHSKRKKTIIPDFI